MKKLLSFLLLAVLSISVSAQKHETIGPEKGALILAGGGALGEEIISKFVELAGGKNATIIVIPTASGAERFDENSGFIKQLKDYGATKVSLLHTYNREVANSYNFVKPLQKATGVWFTGGRQWRLVDAYAGTKTEKALRKVLHKGGVIGGSSAGATIQGSYLTRGDTHTNQIMMGDHEEGFSYIKNIAIDQHVLARNRHFDMFEILEKRPELLGIGIDEGTAMIVQKNAFEVIGVSKVLIYDGTFWSRNLDDIENPPRTEKVFYMLQHGDCYNMKERKVIQ